MSRIKISEYRAKQLLYNYFGSAYQGIEIDLISNEIDTIKNNLIANERYVIKVDQAIKKRNKLGLVFIDVDDVDVTLYLWKIKKMGYRWVLIEPYVRHEDNEEKYCSLELTENGIRVLCSSSGGINIEQNSNTLSTFDISNGFVAGLGVPDEGVIQKLVEIFNLASLTNLEVNPFITKDGMFIPLDAAVQVDSSAQPIVGNLWAQKDFRIPQTNLHPAEQEVEKLASKSSSSLNMKVLNENGSIFMLLSGGGASVVISDELARENLQHEVANYGEYSGNPSEEDTYLYAKQILKLLVNSKSKSKVLVIAGGVANFTDVSSTFNGIVRAIDDHKEAFIKDRVSVIVRRGGPNEVKGLSMIRKYFNDNNIKSNVFGSDYSLSSVTDFLKKGMEL